MLQRKQSVFLFISALPLIALFLFPLASFIGITDSLLLYIYKLESLVPDQIPAFPQILVLVLAFMVILMLLISVVSIFIFKNRKMQIFLMKTGMIVNLILIAVFFFYYVHVLEKVTGAVVTYEVGAYLLLIPFIFYVLAYRGIVSDEKLIRSADRLR